MTSKVCWYQSAAAKLLRARDFILGELGVQPEQLNSFSALSRLLHAPRDPTGLAVIRILYGCLMCIDVHHERGLWRADSRWGDPNECRFPLLPFLKPLPLQFMIILYSIMLLGAFGVTLGFHYRKSCLFFLVPYWYIFLLDKTHWNNHSYLFGLIGTQLMLSGANRAWSIDSLQNPDIRNKHVPLWNYAVIRGQIFLVYFIAGLKKTNLDWIMGYSMEKLGYHWVFDGFRILLTDDQITHLVVHVGGFLLDLTVGFFMLMRFSRPYAFFFCGLFNLMNSRMFAIVFSLLKGMFPYVMIAIMPIFCSADWPQKILSSFPGKPLLYEGSPGKSPDCIYEEENSSTDESSGSPSKRRRCRTSSVSRRHQITTALFCTYFCLQGFLPYSHWLTKGYNTWTQGLYGYSWDMMVNNWRHVHTTLTVVEKNTGRHLHLDPKAWARGHRWTHHADMVKQLAHCVEDRLAQRHGLRNISVFIDVWVSLNRRFTQRMYDPSVDILSAHWSPFEEVSWVLPLQTELNAWRPSLLDTESKIFNQSEHVDVVFVTDFPGFHLLNYIGKHLDNTTLRVMKGVVEVQFEPNHVVQLKKGQSMQLPSGSYHRVSPVKHRPACYMYVYFNNRTGLEQGSNGFLPAASCSAGDLEVQRNLSCGWFCWERIKKDFWKKFQFWSRSITLIGRAVYSITFRSPMVVKKEELIEDDWN